MGRQEWTDPNNFRKRSQFTLPSPLRQVFLNLTIPNKELQSKKRVAETRGGAQTETPEDETSKVTVRQEKRTGDSPIRTEPTAMLTGCWYWEMPPLPASFSSRGPTFSTAPAKEVSGFGVSHVFPAYVRAFRILTI
jgi:hypothetical protein